MSHRVIAFDTLDTESTAEIQALDAADLEGLGRENRESGLDVNLAGAQLVSGQVRIAVRGCDDLEVIQHYFKRPVRWVTRRELLASAR